STPHTRTIINTIIPQQPRELEESAKLDGWSELGVFWRNALPLSKPVIATFSLFYSVGILNEFIHALLYINYSAKWP
ncbi:ABC transporter permease subunit, partial [Bacillus vallismortis]|nr:ABC transporter permease subunit [Bacillus vallismortis]